MDTALRSSLSLRGKLFLSFVLAVLSCAYLVSLANRYYFTRDFEKAVIEGAHLEAEAVAREVGRWLEENRSSHEIAETLIEENYGRPSPVTVVWLDPIAAVSDHLPTFHLSGGDVEALKKGRTVGGAYDPHHLAGRGGHYSAVPVTLHGEVRAAVVAFTIRPEVKMPDQSWLKKNAWILRNLILTLIPACLLAFWLTNNLLSPITRLREAAFRLKRGDFSARSGLKRSDEIGELATTFDLMAARIEKQITTRSRLLGDISHELCTPVTTLTVNIEALLDGVVTEERERQRCLESLLRQVEHLSYLVVDLTELSRFETGSITLVQEPFAAAEPMEQAVEPSLLLAQRHGVSLTHEAVEASVLGDKRRIMQVLKNLISNAIVHNPPGTKVAVRALVEDGHVIYEVADDGPPIPDEFRDSLFERFYKVDESRRRGPAGAGLGLSIVSEILKAHDSRIELHHEQGSKTFRFSLPRH